MDGLQETALHGTPGEKYSMKKLWMIIFFSYHSLKDCFCDLIEAWREHDARFKREVWDKFWEDRGVDTN